MDRNPLQSRGKLRVNCQICSELLKVLNVLKETYLLFGRAIKTLAFCPRLSHCHDPITLPRHCHVVTLLFPYFKTCRIAAMR